MLVTQDCLLSSDAALLTLKLQNIKGADALEGVDFLLDRYWTMMSRQVTVILIKIKMLQDLRALQCSNFIRPKVSQELIDSVRAYLVGNIISRRTDMIESQNHSDRIRGLKTQIWQLFKIVSDMSPKLWPAMIDPGIYLNKRPGSYCEGPEAHSLITLKFYYQAWAETPGAIGMIKNW